MSDNYAPLWALVDSYRERAKRAKDRAAGARFEAWSQAQNLGEDYVALADTLERALREATGDLPVKEEEQQPDLILAYSGILAVLEDAAMVLHRLADRSGHTVRQVDSNQARVIANRCDRALYTLKKAGELL